MPRLRVLLVGDFRRLEFQEAGELLASTTDLVTQPDVASAVARLAQGQPAPDVVVLAQAWPGQFAASDLDRLQRQAPLARAIGLLGTWCEGEARTGEPWPAAERIYWHQWAPGFLAELARLRDGDCPAWGLPLTATDEERLRWRTGLRPDCHAGSPPLGDGPEACFACPTIVIHSLHGEMAEWLAMVCRRHGYAVVLMKGPMEGRLQGISACIWDDGGNFADWKTRLADFKRVVGGAPLLALLGFPRSEDRQQALDAGAASVVSKPVRLDDLLSELRRLVKPPARLPLSSVAETAR